jgi:hypothetical protein
MPASEKMESSFSSSETRCCRDASRSGGLQTAESEEGGLESALPCLMHARRHAVTAIGLDAGRAAGERAEKHNRRNEGK